MSDRIVHMRASPAIGLGGMYATGQGLEEPVRVIAMIPPVADKQVWIIRPEDDNEDKAHIILKDEANHIPWVWSFSGERPIPGAPIVLSTEPEKDITWRIKPVDNGHKDAYVFIADVHLIGATWYAGTNRNSEVVFEVLPIDVPDEQKPYWVLKKATSPN